MKTSLELLPVTDPGALERAREIIQRGGLIAFPTDTVYGIGASAFDQDAIEAIYLVKERSHLKAIPILIGDPGEIGRLAASIPPSAERLIHHFWPGALTLVLPIHPDLPPNLSEGETIGIRVPDHLPARELLRATGPLAATSANLSGQPSALTAQEVQHSLAGRLDLILDGGPAPGGLASTVLDLTADPPRILREGPVSAAEIQEILHGQD